MSTGKRRGSGGRRSGASRGGRVTAPFFPSIVDRRFRVAPTTSLLLADDPPLEPGSHAVVVPCCGNANEFAALAESGQPLLRFDTRNRGGSDAVSQSTDLGFAAEASDLSSLVNTAQLGTVDLVAWSYHVGAAVQFALDQPHRVRRMVLAASLPTHTTTPFGPGKEPTPAELAYLDQLQAGGVPLNDPETWCRAWRAVYVPLRMGNPEAFSQLAPVCHLPNEQPHNVVRTLLAVLSDLHPYDWRPQLRSLEVPVLVVHGSADPDPVDMAREWVQLLPDARLLEIVGVGTIPWAEAPDRFFGIVNRFLRGEPV